MAHVYSPRQRNAVPHGRIDSDSLSINNLIYFFFFGKNNLIFNVSQIWHEGPGNGPLLRGCAARLCPRNLQGYLCIGGLHRESKLKKKKIYVLLHLLPLNQLYCSKEVDQNSSTLERHLSPPSKPLFPPSFYFILCIQESKKSTLILFLFYFTQQRCLCYARALIYN